ncbi:hypothetical protein LKD70_18375 [Ruminococcus sp. CLA-AA-H200]|uniref:Uncharacterized protein n=2 Tax=Ruminococcus turbiniformis TaxID=2881258 RepID=A0ABS8G1Z9_9FIRM|nr:hypothetical protein [Ruminococcus turbiniformis]
MFLDGLQECVADDDCIILMETGHEKLRHQVGGATIITSTEFCVLNLATIVLKKAREILNNPEWNTQVDY